MSGIIHPWRRFREHFGFTLVWHDDGDMGVTCHEKREVSLRRGLTQAERRCTILHECLHIERGPTTAMLKPREELRVRRETARLMLPDIKVVGEELAWARDLEEAAFELWVDVGVLEDRLQHLHPAERAYLKARLGEVDG